MNELSLGSLPFTSEGYTRPHTPETSIETKHLASLDKVPRDRGCWPTGLQPQSPDLLLSQTPSKGKEGKAK